MTRALLVFCSTVFASGPARIHSVETRGSQAPITLETSAGEPFDAARIGHDVHRLWETGRFQDIRVETTEPPEGLRVVFQLVPKPGVRLRELRFEPENPGLQFKLGKDTPIDEQRAWQIAAEAGEQLRQQGYPNPTVTPALKPVNAEHADLILHVETGKHSKIDQVSFSGDAEVPPRELCRALKAVHIRTLVPGVPGLWRGWRLLPNYSEAAVQNGLAQLKSLYLSKGYFDAQVALGRVTQEGSKTKLEYSVHSGPRREFAYENLCRMLIQERRQAETQGVLDFQVRLDLRGPDPLPVIGRGPAYRVGRIEFRGSHSFSDSSVRRNLLLDEGDLLDRMRLRKSLARLNRTGWFEPLSESNVSVNTDPRRQRADLIVNLKEIKRGRWSFSGPVGPISFAGPLQFSLASRLPAWGHGLLELSPYAVSFNALGFARALPWFSPFPNKRFLPVIALERPYQSSQRWTSGFLYSPQLGWKGVVGSYLFLHAQGPVARLAMTGRSLTPPLTVTVEDRGELYCQPPKTRLDIVRQATSTAANLMMSFRPF